MNTASSAPGASLLPDGTSIITTTHFIFIAVLMVLALAVIIAGVGRARRRRQARTELESHNAQIAGQAPSPQAVPPAVAPDVSAPAAPAIAPAPVEQPSRPHLTVVPDTLEAAPADGPVTQLKGLGPKVAQRLADHGITTVGQLAALTDDQAAALDAQMGPFAGRMGRDRWQEQARFLAMGDVQGFEAVFGRL